MYHNSPGLSRQNILRSVEESLSRLQTSYIDLLYTHVWDYGTPLEETLETLHWLVQQGKVRYIGGSNMTGWQLQLAACLSKKEGMAKYSVLQQQYSLLCREPEWEVLEVAAREGVGILPWSPLKGGWLSGKMFRLVQTGVIWLKRKKLGGSLMRCLPWQKKREGVWLKLPSGGFWTRTMFHLW